MRDSLGLNRQSRQQPSGPPAVRVDLFANRLFEFARTPGRGVGCPHKQIVAVLMMLSAFVGSALAEDTGRQLHRPPVVLTERAKKLHASALMIDAHDGMPWELRKQGSSSFDKMDISKPQPKLQT